MVRIAQQYRGAMKVAIMGTRGVPASYGGFETAVEEIGTRLASRGFKITVYCRNPGQTLTEYKGMRLVNLPALRHRFAETLSHTSLSVARAITKDKPDVALVLNTGNAPLIPILRAAGVPVAIHLDGLESKREKWRGAGARYYQWAEKTAVRYGDEVIADAHAIAHHIQTEYGRTCTVIPYGADVIHPGGDRLAELGVIRRDYHLVVARLEPENHVLEAVHGYTMSDETRPLLVVGSAPYSQWYIDKVAASAREHPSVRLLGAIYDRELLDQLYANARTYIHGHSVGGTNPSLLRAMGAGAPVLAYDCEFNREVTAERAFFWRDADTLATILDEVAEGDVDSQLARMSEEGRQRVASHYQWESVTDAYQELIYRLAAHRQTEPGSVEGRAARGR